MPRCPECFSDDVTPIYQIGNPRGREPIRYLCNICKHSFTKDESLSLLFK